MEIKEIGRGGPGEGQCKQNRSNTCCKFSLVVVILTLYIYSIEHKMIRDSFYGMQEKLMFSQLSVCLQSALWILVYCSALLWHSQCASYWIQDFP